MAPRAAVAAVLLALLLAGCAAPPAPTPPSAANNTTTTPPAANNTTLPPPPTPSGLPANGTLRLLPGLHNPPAGGTLSFAAEVGPDLRLAEHLEVHFGPASVPDPRAGAYPGATELDVSTSNPSSAVSNFVGVLEPGGVTFARLHAVLDGADRWSDEVRFDANGTPELSFGPVQVPARVEAGVPFQVRFHLDGNGSVAPSGLSLSPVLPMLFQRTISLMPPRPHLDQGQPRAAYAAPQEVVVNLTLPTAGTWYYRPHSGVTGRGYWGAQGSVLVEEPAGANVLELRGGPTEPGCLLAAATVCAGSPVQEVFQFNGPAGKAPTRAGLWWSNASSASLASGGSPATWTNATFVAAEPFTFPALRSVNVTFPANGTYFLRGFVELDGAVNWTPERRLDARPRPGNDTPAFGHEHAAFALFLGGQQVRFTDPAFDASRIFGKAHLHVNEANGGSVIHLEGTFPGGVPDLTLGQFFAQYNVTFSRGVLQLDTHDGHNGTTWVDTGAAAWRVLVSHRVAGNRSAFVAVPGDYAGLVLRDGDRVLVTYGSGDPAELLNEEAFVPEPPTPT